MPDYFTLAELRALPQVADTSKFPDARVEAVAAEVTAIIDAEIFGTEKVGFVARNITETRDGNGRAAIVLRTPYVSSLTTVTVGGTSVDVNDLTATGGILRYKNAGPTWPVGRDNVVVTYSARYGSTVPGDIKEAALQATRWRLLATAPNSELNARQTSMTNEVGGTISYSVAGTDRPTGYPTIDATIVRWRDRIGGGFA